MSGKRGPTNYAQPKEVGFEINLGFLKGTYKIDADETQQNAAWELYIELITRITIVELKPEEGMLREALTSLHSQFGTTRQVLRKYGPKLGRAWGDNSITVAQLAVIYLNDVLRPVLATWHPLLLEHEHLRPVDKSAAAHEKEWDRAAELRAAIDSVRLPTARYADALALIASVPEIAVSSPTP